MSKIYRSIIFITSRSAPARTADRKSQFLAFAHLRLATLKLTALRFAPSKFAFLRLTPSITVMDPFGSSQLHFCKEAKQKNINFVR